MKQVPLCLLVTALLVNVSQAQNLQVEGSSPEQWETNVSLETTVSFTFSHPLDPQMLDDELSTAVIFAGEDIVMDLENITFTNNFMTVNIPVTHPEEGDYAWVIGAMTGAEGELLTEPFVLNYTTLSDLGDHSVSGTVSIFSLGGELPAKRGYEPASLAGLIDKLLSHEVARNAMAEYARAHAKTDVTAQPFVDPTNTVVMLLDGDPFNGDEDPEEEEDFGLVRATVVEGEAGTYALDGVRDGTYWLLALRFRPDGSGLFGALDAFGTFFGEDEEPASITVDGESLSDIDIIAFHIAALTAREAEESLRPTAEGIFEDAELKLISGAPIAEDGTSYSWEFVYYSEGEDMSVRLAGAALFVSPEIEEGLAVPEGTLTIPDEYVDSDQAWQVAQENQGAEFLATHPNALVIAEGGNLFWEFENEEDDFSERFVWKISYFALFSDNFEGDWLEVFVDMETGEHIETRTTPVSSEPLEELPGAITLRQNYPNPFNPSTTIPFEMAQTGHVTLKVFNLIGQHVATLVDGVVPAGTHAVIFEARDLPSGGYLYQLQFGDLSRSRQLILHK